MEQARKASKVSFLTRDSRLILLSVLLNTIPIGYMNVIPAVYLLEVGISASTIGVIYASSAVSNTLALTPFGILADKFGRKKFFFIGSLVPAISYVIFGLTLNPYWLVVASVIGGVGLAGGIALAISGPALLPLLARATSDKNRTALFGATQAAWASALSLGSLLSYIPGLFVKYLAESQFNAHAISYYFMALLALASAIPVIFIKGDEKRKVTTTEEASEVLTAQRRSSLFGWLQFSSTRESNNSRSSTRGIVAKFSIVYALAGLGLGVIVQLLPSWYYLRFSVPESTAGLWIGIAEVGSIPTMFAIPYLVRMRGTLYIATVFGAVAAFFLGLMALTSIFLFAASLFVIRNIFVNISWPVLQSYMMGIVPENERATATGIATTAWGVTDAIGTLVGGDLLALGNLTLPFLIAVVGYVGSSAALWIFFRKIKPPEELQAAEN